MPDTPEGYDLKFDPKTQVDPETVEGKKVLTFDGIPVKRCDGIVNTESQVTAAV
ncbi:phage major capsid protein [Desulfovibrio sp. ZJ369]|uniref:phage major capsid protein n=1 Tax=Desulfovibrio sp. ZJ369 TaxID=2709793 RepID=UPI0013EACBDE|nr:hypothetical protein [Desulfovibrio sp. ZJ369]